MSSKKKHQHEVDISKELKKSKDKEKIVDKERKDKKEKIKETTHNKNEQEDDVEYVNPLIKYVNAEEKIEDEKKYIELILKFKEIAKSGVYYVVHIKKVGIKGQTKNFELQSGENLVNVKLHPGDGTIYITITAKNINTHKHISSSHASIQV